MCVYCSWWGYTFAKLLDYQSATYTYREKQKFSHLSVAHTIIDVELMSNINDSQNALSDSALCVIVQTNPNFQIQICECCGGKD